MKFTPERIREARERTEQYKRELDRPPLSNYGRMHQRKCITDLPDALDDLEEARRALRDTRDMARQLGEATGDCPYALIVKRVDAALGEGPTLASFVGAAPDLIGNKTTEEWLDKIRPE